MGQSIGYLIPFIPLRFRLWFGERFFPLPDSHFGRVVRLSWHRIVKRCTAPEIEAMQYVAEHTDVPIPKVYAVHPRDDGQYYIEMEFVQGQSLDVAWAGLSKTEKDVIVADMKQHISNIRALVPPSPDIVSSALGNPIWDVRIGHSFLGPATIEDFHLQLRERLHADDVPLLGAALAEVHLKKQYKICFTHGDLAPRNVIIRNGRVVAIIDWEFAGWYPEYWEYTKAHYVPFYGEGWWDAMDVMLPKYETELKAEAILCETLPDPGSLGHSFRNGVRIPRLGSAISPAWLISKVVADPDDLWVPMLRRHRVLNQQYRTRMSTLQHKLF